MASILSIIIFMRVTNVGRVVQLPYQCRFSSLTHRGNQSHPLLGGYKILLHFIATTDFFASLVAAAIDVEY